MRLFNNMEVPTWQFNFASIEENWRTLNLYGGRYWPNVGIISEEGTLGIIYLNGGTALVKARRVGSDTLVFTRLKGRSFVRRLIEENSPYVVTGVAALPISLD